MQLLILTSLCFLAVARPALADTGQREIIALIKHQASAIATMNATAFKADWIDGGSIIDDLPPHIFNGQGFQETWFEAYKASVSSDGLTNIQVTIRKAQKITITGDVAYAVFPATFFWNETGEQVQMNVTWTFALKHTSAGWRIVAWAIGSSPPEARPSRRRVGHTAPAPMRPGS